MQALLFVTLQKLSCQEQLNGSHKHADTSLPSTATIVDLLLGELSWTALFSESIFMVYSRLSAAYVARPCF